MDDELETNHQRCTHADEAAPASCNGENGPPQPLAAEMLAGGDDGPPVPIQNQQQQEQLALGDEEVEEHESALSIVEEDTDRAPIPIQQQEQQLDDAKRKANAEISMGDGTSGIDERYSLVEAEEMEEDPRPIVSSRAGASFGEVGEEEVPSISAPRQRSRPRLCLADCDNEPPVPIQQQEQLLALDDKAVKNKKKQEARAGEQKSVMSFVEEGPDCAPIPVQQQMQQLDDAKEKAKAEISTANSTSEMEERDSTTELVAEETEEDKVDLGLAVSRVGTSLEELEEARVEISSMPTPRNDAADARLAPDEEIPIYEGIVVPTERTRLQTWVEHFRDNYKLTLGLTILAIASAITVGVVLDRRRNRSSVSRGSNFDPDDTTGMPVIPDMDMVELPMDPVVLQFDPDDTSTGGSTQPWFVSVYMPEFNVNAYASLDLDMREIDFLATTGNEEGLLAAWDVYSGADGDSGGSGLTLQDLTAVSFDFDGSETLKLYKDFYGMTDYSDKWLQAAFNEESTESSFSSGKVDFTKLDLEGRSAAVQHGIRAMAIWGYIVGLVEKTAENCHWDANDNNADEIKMWDRAVALYVGSTARKSGVGGHLLYTLANEECYHFGTCKKGEEAPVNKYILAKFANGKLNLDIGGCSNLKNDARDIKAFMTVPLIQAASRTMYTIGIENSTDGALQGEAAAYAAALLPLMDQCGRGNSKIIEANMLPGKSPLGSYDVVKAAFERCYEKLGVSCQDVGGLVIKKQDDTSLIGSKCDLRYTGDTSEQVALVPALPPAEPTPLPSPRPQSDAPTDVATPTHEQRPKWFQTLHPDFQELSLFQDENDVTVSQLAQAALFCYRQAMFLCTYDVICPNGKGNPPFKGGPPNATNTESLDETQWVPYYRSNVHPNPQKEKDEAGKTIQLDQKEGKQWAQIGKIPDGKGGSDENSYGLCWDYDEWSNYDAVDIEDIWGEETRVWMLCCSDPDENSNDAVGSGFKPTLQPTNNATSNRHKCACEAEEMDFKIDCDDRQAMTDALDFINTNGCTEKGSCEAGTECEKNYLTVQSHYNLCPEENIPEAIEDGIHDFDESCLGCDILRAYTVGAPDCPAAVCTDTSGEDAYVSLIEKNCASDCSTDECKGLFLTLRVVHESCPNGVLTDAAERGLQDLEGLCKDVICNAGGKDDDPFTCTEVDKAGYDDRDDYRVTFSPAPSPSTYEPTLTAFPTTDPPVETVPDRG